MQPTLGEKYDIADFLLEEQHKEELNNNNNNNRIVNVGTLSNYQRCLGKLKNKSVTNK